MPSRARPKGRGVPSVELLRLGHRAGRDPRLTTHLALVARAFGARRMYLHPPDPAIAERLAAVARRWGGTFEVVGVEDWRRTVREFDGLVVHLTMYGLSLERVAPRLARASHLLVVVGGAKVPPALYGLAGVNVAVGHQPHSEVGAAAVFLDRVRGGVPASEFVGAECTIVPRARGKSVRTARSRSRR
ncbi:MAG: tRNA (cytidine(56)-2'-O)-methyltransferase [Thermoplasmata archaeon]|nr:tRNA (cytidine(56)-2'-O)-methyltransferase [Thermoplasmata archaeon]